MCGFAETVDDAQPAPDARISEWLRDVQAAGVPFVETQRTTGARAPTYAGSENVRPSPRKEERKEI